MEFKGTKGKWTYSKQKGTIGHCFQAQVWKQDSNSLAVLNPTKEEQEANANALLISKAPEMLEMLKKARKALLMLDSLSEEIEQLIKEATDINEPENGSSITSEYY